MAKERKLLTVTINAVIFILMEVAALAMLDRAGDLQHLWISRAGYRVRASAWRASESVRDYLTLRSENDVLAAENQALLSEVASLRHQVLQYEAGGQSAQVPQSDGYTYIPATIRKVSRNTQHNYIILDKGSEDGVMPQSGIVTANGVVGIIDAVDRHFSYGISFMNTNMSVSARIGDQGAVGPLSWDGRSTNRALLQQIPLQFRVSPGDTVWTSGYSQFFPAGIPLGTARETRIINGAVNEISVELFEDFTSLHHVTIVCSEFGDEISYLENLGNGQE